MKLGLIDGIDFCELEAEKYWSFPKSYKGDPKTETRNMIMSGDYLGSVKKDGAYYRFVKDMEGNMVLQGRSKSVNGEYLNKIDWVPHLHEYFKSLPNGTCLLGELYFPNKEGSNHVTTITGCLVDKAIARQEKGDKLHYYVFDCWAWDGQSAMKIDMLTRAAMFETSWPTEGIFTKYRFPYVEYAKYARGQYLWDLLEDTLDAGGEGIVITKASSTPSPGKRTARKTLKIKKEIANTIDVFFTGKGTAPSKEYTGKEIETWKYWINPVTDERLPLGEYDFEYSVRGANILPVTKPYYYKWAGSLEFGVVKEDKVVPLGLLSGLPDEMKSSPAAQKGKVIEVTCMQIFENEDGTPGGLRHAKMVKERPDKNWKDCKWEDIF